MANVTRSSRKLKDEDNNSTRQKFIDSKGTRKSLRLEKLTLGSPSVRKSKRVEKQTMPSPLRRSDRGGKNCSTTLGSNKTYKELSSLDKKRKNDKREKNGKHVVVDVAERSRVAKIDTGVPSLTSPKKRLDSRSYHAAFKRGKPNGQVEKLNVWDGSPEKKSDGWVDGDSREIEGNQDESCESEEDLVQEKHGEEGCGRSVECLSSGDGDSKDIEEDQDKSSESEEDLVQEKHGEEGCGRYVECLSSGEFDEGKNNGAKCDSLVITAGSSNGDNSPSSKCSGRSLQSCSGGVTPVESTLNVKKVEAHCLTDEDGQSPDLVESTLKERSESIGLESPDLQKASAAGAFRTKRKVGDLYSDVFVTGIGAENCANAARAESVSVCGSEQNHSLDICSGSSKRRRLDSKFVEYWVPVQLSNVQLELYCSTLLSSSTLLCSCSRNDPIGALRDILISLRKCCDHPYLTDPSIYNLLKEGLSETQIMDVEIRASGKFQVLEKILFEVRKRGLRALIIFQSIGGPARNSLGEVISLGVLLEDFLGYRFGKDSYERVDSGLAYSKKQLALSRFNDKEKERFVFLIENRACLASIKLSSIDLIILFDSDWNPLNDLKALQRISIESQFEELMVFRLYSALTVEEKVLILAKNNVTLECSLQNVNPSITQTLLCWGADDLFNRLDGFHATSSSGSDVATEDSFSDEVVQELLNQLASAQCTNMTNCSIISKVQQCGSCYHGDVSLPGETKRLSNNEELPYLFWTKLLAGKCPQWRFLSAPSPRVKRKPQYLDNSPKRLQNEDDVVKRKKVVTSSVDPVSLKSTPKDKQRAVNNKDATVTETVEAQVVGYEEKRNLRNLQKDLHLSLEPEILKLCDILQLPGSVKDTARRFLDYILNNYRVATDPPPLLQAFKLSVCLSAASLMKYKLSRRESLALAKQHLDFECKEEEALLINDKLRKLKKMFSDQEKVMEPDFADFPVSRTKEGSEKNLVVNTSHSKLSDQQELEEGEIRESPKSHNHIGQNASSKQEQSCDSEKTSVSTTNDLSESIKEVKKIHGKRMRILATKQMEELEQFNKYREEELEKEKEELERRRKIESAVIRYTFSQAPVRFDYLRTLDSDFFSKLQKVHNRIDAEEKMLVARQLALRNEEKQLMTNWLEEAKSGRSVDRFSTTPLSYSDFRIGELEVGEERHVDTQETSSRIFHPSLGIQDPDGNLLNKTASAETPSYLSSEVVGATICPELETAARESGRQNIDVNMSTTMAPKNPNVIVVQKCSQVGTSVGQTRPMELTRSDSLGQRDVTAAPDSETQSLQKGQYPDDSETSKALLPEVPGDIVGTAVGTEVQTLARNSGGENERMDVTMASDDANGISVQEGSHEGILVDGPISASLEQASLESLSPKIVACPASDGEVPSLKEQTLENLESSVSVGLSTKDTPIPVIQENQHPLQQVVGPSEPADAGKSSSLLSPSGAGMEPPFPEIPSSEIDQIEMNVCAVTENSQGNGANTVSQQFEVRTQPVVGPSEPADAGKSSSLVSPSGPEMELPSPEIPSSEIGPIEMNVFAATENSQSNGSNTVSQQFEARTQPAESQNMQCNDSNLQPDVASVSGNLMRENSITQNSPLTQAPAEAQNGQSNPSVAPLQPYLPVNSGVQPLLRAPVASRMYQSWQIDPLQHELGKMRKEIDQAMKMREEVKVHLNLECERELEEVRRKYNCMIQDADRTLLEKQNTLETNYKKVEMHHKLAEVFRLKGKELKPSGAPAPGLEHLVTGQTQDLRRPVQFSPRQQMQRAATAPPVQVVHNSAALFSTNPRRPHVNPVVPPIRNQQLPSEIRAAPPHLRPFRPSSSMSMSNRPPLTSVMRPPPPFSGSATTSSAFPPFPAPTPYVQPSAAFGRVPQSEPGVGLRVFHNSPQSAVELIPGVCNLPVGNPSPNPLPPLQGRNLDTWDMTEPSNAGASSSAAQVDSSAGDVVCVSDDD